MNLSFIAQTYQLACPDVPPEQGAEIVEAALGRAREKHADLDRFLPAMEFLSSRIFTDHKSLPLDAYIEVLYCAVKHGDFSREWRKEIARARAMEQTASATVQ